MATPTREAAFALRERFRAQVDGELLRAFERAFDALGLGDDVVRIPRLELEIRVGAGEAGADIVTRRVAERLDDALREWVARRPDALHADRAKPAIDRRRTLLHHLAHGQVEWHAGAESAQELAQSLRTEASVLAREPGALDDLLRGPAVQRVAAVFRLLELLPVEERTALLDRVVPADDGRARTPPASLLRRLLASGRMPMHLLLRVQALLLVTAQAGPGEAIEAELAAVLRACLEQAAMLDRSLEIAAAIRRLPLAEHRDDENPVRGAGPMVEKRMVAAGRAEGVLAHDAGVVILHPYLGRLFHAAGIGRGATGGIEDSSLARAAALLHWLLAGREEIHEFELALIKVLLGLAPDRMLLVAGGLLSDEDRAQADALLAAAVSHWAALGATRIDGLRRTFLQRRGVLRDVGQGWSLQVEPAAFDVLLAKLPWTLGIVRLPWMTRPIFIDWPTA